MTTFGTTFCSWRTASRIAVGMLAAQTLMGCSGDNCVSTSGTCSGFDDNDEVDVSPGASSSDSSDGSEASNTDSSDTATDSQTDTTQSDTTQSDTTQTADDVATGNSDATTTDQVDPDITDTSTEDLSCDAEQADLSDCDLCVRSACCAELLDCSDNTACSGAASDDGLATGEFGCIQDFIAEAEVNDGFVDLITLEDAKDACRASNAISPETEALVGCMLVESSPDNAADTCASLCLGIIQ